MRVVVGSKNPVKIKALEDALVEYKFQIEGASVDSKVRPQPLSNEETRLGAINRAKACVEMRDADLGIGLEGGVYFSDDLVYLCNWGALCDKEGNLCVVSGPTFRLPDQFKIPLLTGKELNDVMFDILGLKEVGSKEGAIGFFTNGTTNRKEVFKQMVQILFGQHQYYKNLASV